MAWHVSKSEFAKLVEMALTELPEEFSAALDEMSVEIKDWPTSQQLLLTGVKRNGLLLGLYQGRPRTLRSVEDSGQMPDVIYLFQGSIEAICQNSEELIQQVRTTVLHEIGHHFGMNEEDLRRLGYG
jgi:predicted Zn-dependent protease with MMP-like domain